VVETQEEYVAKLPAGHSILIKLDDFIAECDAVIHLVGQQTSQDGRAASQDAVNDLLRSYNDFPEVVGLTEAELRTLSYSQWEAWLKVLLATPTATGGAGRNWRIRNRPRQTGDTPCITAPEE